MHFGADFDALIARFSPNSTKPVALAVSGGSDSIALLWLAHEWARRRGRQLLVLTVDHQLRAASGSEALDVARLVETLGHQHQTLVWRAPNPSQNAARHARYGLMATYLQENGADCLLTGHTFDDVLETAVLRRRRGVRSASIAGPSLAAVVPAWPAGRSITLLRPLIHSSRSELRAHLRAQNSGWVDDPSNENLKYERVRVRQFLARHPALFQIASNFVMRVQHQRAEAQSQLAHEILKVSVHGDGLMDTGPAQLSSQLLTLLARCASGTSDDPRGGAVAQLLETVNAPGMRQTLGGAWFQKTATGYLVGRDPGSSLAAKSDLFDGRFERALEVELPMNGAMSFLVRQSAPPDPHWREIISERLGHLALCYQTPLLTPVQR